MKSFYFQFFFCIYLLLLCKEVNLKNRGIIVKFSMPLKSSTLCFSKNCSKVIFIDDITQFSQLKINIRYQKTSLSSQALYRYSLRRIEF